MQKDTTHMYMQCRLQSWQYFLAEKSFKKHYITCHALNQQYTLAVKKVFVLPNERKTHCKFVWKQTLFVNAYCRILITFCMSDRDGSEPVMYNKRVILLLLLLLQQQTTYNSTEQKSKTQVQKATRAPYWCIKLCNIQACKKTWKQCYEAGIERSSCL